MHVVKQFFNSKNSNLEKEFARIFTEKNNINLVFKKCNMAFTDGKNIVIDPTLKNMYKNKVALQKVNEFMLKNSFNVNDELESLKLITRCINIHESLHILYSKFPSLITMDKRFENNNKYFSVLKIIDNAIEDVYIENIGKFVYDGIRKYIDFLRLLMLYSDLYKEEKEELPEEIENEIEGIKLSPACIKLQLILSYVFSRFIYPYFEVMEIEEIKEYTNKIIPIYHKAVVEKNFRRRYDYSVEVLEILKDLIDECSEEEIEEITNRLKEFTGDFTKELKKEDYFSNNPIEPDGDIFFIIDRPGEVTMIEFDEDAEETIRIINEYREKIFIEKGMKFSLANVHKNIDIKEIYPKIDFRNKEEYLNICRRNRMQINKYRKRIETLLKLDSVEYEDKKLFGSNINSKRMFDIKNRIWGKNVETRKFDNLSIILMIDNSGSMMGSLMRGAIESSVILHEVLEGKIKHSIVKHRAIYHEDILEHKILYSFKPRKNEKYNIVDYDCDDGTREGLSIRWAKKYIDKYESDKKLIIMISDGMPAHVDSKDIGYLGDFAIIDSKVSAKSVEDFETKIIAIALDDEDEDIVFHNLKNIYRNVVRCDKIDNLIKNLFKIIEDEFK